MKLINLKLSVAASLSAVLLISGCAASNQRSPRPEEREMALQMQQAFLQRMRSGNLAMAQMAQMQQPSALVAQNAVQPNIQQNAQVPHIVTEEELLRTINAFPEPAVKQAIILERDGLKIGSQMYLDAEGQIVTFAANKATGDVTYIVAKPGGEFSVKYIRAGSTGEPVLIATAARARGIWSVRTVTGKALTGNSLIPTSKGLVMARSSSAFVYEPGSAIKSFSTPQDYHIADFQNGDIASTGYILLEKDPIESRSDNAAVQLFQLAGSLAKTVTLSEDSDYALMNWRDGQLTTFAKSIYGKNVANGGNNCRVQSKSAGIRSCESLNFREALYEPSGNKNQTHYYWGIFWFNTPEGPFAIAQEERNRKITMTNLATGKKVPLLEDFVAFSNLNIRQSPSGIVRVTATSRLITPKEIPDALAQFKSGASQ